MENERNKAALGFQGGFIVYVLRSFLEQTVWQNNNMKVQITYYFLI